MNVYDGLRKYYTLIARRGTSKANYTKVQFACEKRKANVTS